MDILKQKDVQKLIESSGNWHVSLYLPTHRVGREQQQDPIRFKNLIAHAQERLFDSGLSAPEIQALMRPAEGLLTDRDFWQHQSDGLAVFLSPGFSRIYRLPSRFDELLDIGNSFQIKPLLPLLSQDGQFYILALSMNEIRLFLGTRDTIDQIELDDIPTTMQEALWMDDPEKYVGFHTGAGSPGRARKRQAVFHGQGSKGADGKANILRYFQHIDRGLHSLLEEKNIPMVLAGVDYLLPIYRKANSYAGLLKQALEGNPEELDKHELHKLAWNLVEPIFKEDQNQTLEQFKQLHGQGHELASVDLEKVVRAANFGQVEALFVPVGVQRWGRIDARHNKVILEKKPTSENEDLLDYAAVHTLLNSGKVYAVQPENMPGKVDLAAILRYAT